MSNLRDTSIMEGVNPSKRIRLETGIPAVLDRLVTTPQQDMWPWYCIFVILFLQHKQFNISNLFENNIFNEKFEKFILILFNVLLVCYKFVTHGDVLNNHYPDCITNSCRAVKPKTLSKLLAVCHTSSIHCPYIVLDIQLSFNHPISNKNASATPPIAPKYHLMPQLFRFCHYTY